MWCIRLHIFMLLRVRFYAFISTLALDFHPHICMNMKFYALLFEAQIMCTMARAPEDLKVMTYLSQFALFSTVR